MLDDAVRYNRKRESWARSQRTISSDASADTRRRCWSAVISSRSPDDKGRASACSTSGAGTRSSDRVKKSKGYDSSSIAASTKELSIGIMPSRWAKAARHLTTIMLHRKSYTAGTRQPNPIHQAQYPAREVTAPARVVRPVLHLATTDYAASPVSITWVQPPAATAYRPIKNASASPIRTRHARSLCSAPTNTRVIKFLPSAYPDERMTESARS